VGEATGGGAHPTHSVPLEGHFVLMVPSARPVNAVTKTDWEGTGVQPDVKVTAGQALDKAKQLATDKVAKLRATHKSEAAPAVRIATSNVLVTSAIARHSVPRDITGVTQRWLWIATAASGNLGSDESGWLSCDVRERNCWGMLVVERTRLREAAGKRGDALHIPGAQAG
jgi:hypothetical protein